MFRYSLIVAGYCPFCLGNQNLPITQRVRQWMTKATLLNHIDTHVPEVEGLDQKPCPFPLCHISFESMPDFWAHLFDWHSIEEPCSNCVKRKRKLESFRSDDGIPVCLVDLNSRLLSSQTTTTIPPTRPARFYLQNSRLLLLLIELSSCTWNL